MNIREVNLKKGAIFIADVHYKRGDKYFLNFLKTLLKNPPPQLFLVGDIFHLLLPFRYLIDYNKEAINLINLVSKKSEVYYIRGNHDFWIDGVFENIEVADAFVDKKKSILITHGDLNEKDLFYKFYSSLIRKKYFLKFLNIITLNFIHNKIFKKILQKRVKCNKLKNFELKIKNKITDMKYNIIIEGHYHQNVKYNLSSYYINLGAFYCDRSYYIFEDEIKENRYG